jgi:hypothetical protein
MRDTPRGRDIVRITVAATLLVLGIALVLAPSTRAITSISQSYLSKTALPIGSIVALKENSLDTVEAANTKNSDNIFGVTINSSGSLLTISGTTGTQVQVATSGTEGVLVSDINGPIKQGDALTASPIDGVGMLASDNIRIIGLAQQDMKGGTKTTYKTKSGAQKSVNVAQIPVLVNVSYFFKQPDKTIIPQGIQNVANSLAGKKVDSLPILISSAIFVVMLIVVVSVVYSMIRSSIISVGRNPLSQSAVYRDLIQLSALVLVILAVGLAAIYFILSKL